MNPNGLLTLFFEKNKSDPLLKAFIAIAGDSFIYLIGAAIVGLGNFVLIPIYTRHLSPAEFGVYALADIAVLILVTITQVGLNVSYLKWYAEAQISRRDGLLTSTLIIGALVATIGGGFLTLAVVGEWGRSWLQIADREFGWMFLPIVLFENMQGILLTDLRARRKPTTFSLITIMRLLSIVAASILFIVVRNQGIQGVFAGRLVGDGVSVMLLGIFCLPTRNLRFTWSIVAPMVRYGLPLMLSALIAMLLDASGRYFLSHYSMLDQVGFYGVAIKVANIFQLLLYQPFGIAWGGLLFQIGQWKNARRVYSKIFDYLVIISTAVALILVLFTKPLFDIFTTPAYAPAMSVFPILIGVQAVRLLEYPAAVGIYLGGKTRWFIIIFSVGLGINLLANYLLVPENGMFGASISWLIAWGVIIGFMMWISHRLYSLNYNWKALFIALSSWVVIMLVSPLLSEGPGFSLSILMSLLILLGIGCYLGYDLLLSKM
jgi:O-antigen/teichoic acid export membrane protein